MQRGIEFMDSWGENVKDKTGIIVKVVNWTGLLDENIPSETHLTPKVNITEEIYSEKPYFFYHRFELWSKKCLDVSHRHSFFPMSPNECEYIRLGNRKYHWLLQTQ